MALKRLLVICIAASMALLHQEPLRAAVPADQLLPDTTRAYVSFSQVAQLGNDWKATRLAGLAEDPVMRPFVTAAQKSFERAFLGLKGLAGITVSELSDASGGEAALAIVESKGKSAIVGIADLTGKRMEAEALIKKIDAALKGRGAAVAPMMAGGTKVWTYKWKARGGEARQSTYFLKDDTLVISNNEEVATAILADWDAPEESLSHSTGYRDVIDRSVEAAGRHTPQIYWYLDPFAYAELLPPPTPKEPNPKPTALDLVEKHGEGIKAVGGTLSIATADFDVLSHVAVYAPPADRRGAGVKMLKFEPRIVAPILPWAINEVNSYTEASLNLENLLDNFGPIFDDVAADGAAGAFEGFLKDLRDEERGPRVDLKKDLLAHLESRVEIIGDHTEPAAPKNERMLFAIKTKKEPATADAIKRLMKGDPDVVAETVPGFVHELWRFKDIQDTPMANMGVMVANGYLLIASNHKVIRRLLSTMGGETRLSATEDYQLVMRKMDELGGKDASLRAFSRPSRDLYTTYTLLRAGKLGDVDSLYATIVKRFFGEDEKRIANFPKLDFTKLPVFAAVKKHFQPVGVFVKEEKTGWLAVGFSLP